MIPFVSDSGIWESCDVVVGRDREEVLKVRRGNETMEQLAGQGIAIAFEELRADRLANHVELFVQDCVEQL